MADVLLGQGGGVVLRWSLEPEQLGQLAGSGTAILTCLSEEVDGFGVLAARPLSEQRAGDGVRGVDAGGDGAPGRYVPSPGAEVVLGGFKPR